MQKSYAFYPRNGLTVKPFVPWVCRWKEARQAGFFVHGQPLIIQDAKADQRHFKLVDRVTKHETQSLAAVPLIVRGEVIGVLEALNKKNNAHYTEEDLTILATLGTVAAQTMRNIHLERKVKIGTHRTCRT